MGPNFYSYLLIFLVLSIPTAPLVGLQIVMTRLCGWKGLAYTTTVVVLLIFGGPTTLIAWANGRFGSVPRPSALTELAQSFLFLMPLTFQVPLFIVLVAFLLLALTART
jgi:hypothetical protein